MDELKIIETNHRKPCALYKGYEYSIHRENKCGTTMWRCRKEKREKCKGRILTKEGVVIKETFHDVCRPDVAATEVKSCLHLAKKRAREEDTAIPSIYKEEIGILINKGYEFVTEIPLYSSAKHTLNKIRREEQGFQVEPKNAEDIVLTEILLAFKNGAEDFLLADDESDGGRILIFASQKGKDTLAENSQCFVDGTFKSCPQQFKQIFTIHVDVGSSAEETNIIPVVYGFLPDKRKVTYERFFHLVKESIPDWNPDKLKIDFEEGAVLAIRNAFPNADINGCHFHFTQCLWRKVQELGLVRKYMEEEEIRLHIRMCAALAHLPVEDVEEGWLSIQEESPTDPSLQTFYDYFVSQWFENPTFDVETWNCFNARHRTTNAVEGWHFKLNSLLNRPQPNFSKVITVLKKEAEYFDFIIDRRYLNLDGKRRKLKYVKVDEQIKKTLAEYILNKDIRKCLKTLSYVQKLN